MTAPGRAARVAAEVGPLLRSAPWRLVAVVAGVAAPALFWAAGHFGGDPDDVVWALRGFAVLLALGVAFALDDEALPTLAASPASYARRRGGRIAIAFALVTPLWLTLLLAMATTWPGVPWIAVSFEALSLCLVTLALAAAAQRRGISEPGMVVAPIFLGLLLLADVMSRQWPLMERLGPLWGTSHRNWTIVAILCVGALIATGREPAGRTRRLTRGPSMRRPQGAVGRDVPPTSTRRS